MFEDCAESAAMRYAVESQGNALIFDNTAESSTKPCKFVF